MWSAAFYRLGALFFHARNCRESLACRRTTICCFTWNPCIPLNSDSVKTLSHQHRPLFLASIYCIILFSILLFAHADSTKFAYKHPPNFILYPPLSVCTLWKQEYLQSSENPVFSFILFWGVFCLFVLLQCMHSEQNNP